MKKIIFMLFLSVFTVGITTVTAQSVTVIKDSTIHKGSRTINNYGTVIENNGGTVNINQTTPTKTNEGNTIVFHHEIEREPVKPKGLELKDPKDVLAVHAIDAWSKMVIVLLIVGGVIGFMIVKNKYQKKND